MSKGSKGSGRAGKNVPVSGTSYKGSRNVNKSSGSRQKGNTGARIKK